jgi:hypothetical protein
MHRCGGRSIWADRASAGGRAGTSAELDKATDSLTACPMW